MRLSEVKCNSLKNPMGIDDRKPYFSWQIDTEQNQIYQTAYRLLTDEAAYHAMAEAVNPYGDGRSAGRIVETLLYAEGISHKKPSKFIAK